MYSIVKVVGYPTRVSGSALHCALSARARRLHGGTGIAIIDIVDVCISEPSSWQHRAQYSAALHSW